MSTIDPRDEWAVRDGKVPALAEHPRLCERCGEAPREDAGTLCAACLQIWGALRGDIDAMLDREPMVPVHDLRARCELLVQRWRQTAERRGAEHRGAGEGSAYLQAAIALEEVLEETKGRTRVITISAKPAGVEIGIQMELNGHVLLEFSVPTDQAEAFAGEILKACEVVRTNQARIVREITGPPPAQVVALMESLRESLRRSQ